jgi:hypothetical protein
MKALTESPAAGMRFYPAQGDSPRIFLIFQDDIA